MRMSGMTGVGKDLIALGLLALIGFGGAAEAAVFIYELPDGSRVVTNYPVNNKNYRVVRSSDDYHGIGTLAAHKNSPVFRESPSTYDRLIRRYAEEHGVEFALVKAIMQAESSFNPYAVSHKGARGLMQMMPETASRYGVRDIYNPVENIRAGVKHIKYLSEMFDHKYSHVIAAYNAGENAVKQYRGIPPYEETQNYVKKVLQFKRQYTSNNRNLQASNFTSGS
jgi:soluble lytic murein transglycosylase-like protein